MATHQSVLANYTANLGTAIMGFFEAHHPLSNFHEESFIWEDILWNSSEAAYQAAKSSRELWEDLAKLSPATAKTVGQTVNLDSFIWNAQRLDTMRSVLRAKFAQCPIARETLIDTGAQHLEECNWWGDRFWGTVDGQGKNKLGDILMQIRDEINARGRQ